MVILEKNEFDLIYNALAETHIDYDLIIFDDEIRPEEPTECVVTLYIGIDETHIDIIEGRSFDGKFVAIQDFVKNIKEYAANRDKGLV